jgi:hypothetical protein
MSNTKSPKTFYVPVLALALTLLAFTGCKKEEVLAEETVSPDRIAELKSFVAQSTGVQESKVEYNAQQKSFAVDKDGRITLKDAELRFANSAPGRTQAQGTTQRSYQYTLSRTSAALINIYAESSVSSEWLAALDQAIANWNNTGSYITMKRVSASTTTTTSGTSGKGNGKKNNGGTTTTTTSIPTYNVKVTSYYDASTSTVAWAYMPYYDGTPGNEVSINTYYSYLSAAYKIFTLTHELGHNIGLTHTDGAYGNLIPGTPEVDPNSVMNSFILPWQAFTSYDVIAVNTLYPR